MRSIRLRPLGGLDPPELTVLPVLGFDATGGPSKDSRAPPSLTPAYPAGRAAGWRMKQS
ncbi:MAG: hypothetical protein ACRDRA_13455 [Pseudonocardiaceae bacterium]